MSQAAASATQANTFNVGHHQCRCCCCCAAIATRYHQSPDDLTQFTCLMHKIHNKLINSILIVVRFGCCCCVSFYLDFRLPMLSSCTCCVYCVYLQCPKLFANVFPMLPKWAVMKMQICIPAALQSVAENFDDLVRPLVIPHGTTTELDLLD